MTKQEIYEQIVRLTSELHDTNVVENIFITAKDGNLKKIEEILEDFKERNPDLYQKIISFGKEYNELIDSDCLLGEIFEETGVEEGETSFDAKQIDVLSFFIFMCLANIDNYYLFSPDPKASRGFIKAFKELGYEEMAEFVEDSYWKDHVEENPIDEGQYSTWYELLIAILKGEFSLFEFKEEFEEFDELFEEFEDETE